MKNVSKRKHIGSSFESFLADEGLLEDCRVAAIALLSARPKSKIENRKSKMPTTSYIALLRAVNVGGTGKLAMTDLVALCKKAGFAHARTYIASGNVLFESRLEKCLSAFTGKSAQVLIRTAAEMAAVLAANPFADKAANRTVAIFLDAPPPANTLQHVTGQAGEEIRLGIREIYVHYAAGMAQTKLKIPAGKTGTARNLNTIAKLAQRAAEPRQGK
jgi:uncharacterized protein (DUF1697 family)